ncbi:unnamed protein product [Linum tenue]|uniref:PMI1/PMIR1-2 C-terminal domain-containing protein n=1 Tax=Linum tenue TaxID=586396 RepID=A0AAV0IWH0_9ROSI|nr:unnamed protein product [Linum tenue]
MNHENPLCFQSVDVKKFDEVPQNVGLELSKSIKFLYQKLNEVNLHNSDDLDALAAHLWLEKSSSKDGCDDEFEFTIIDQGIEMPEKFESEIMRTCPSDVGLDGSVIETIDINEIIMDDDESLAAQKMSHVQEIVDDIGSLLVAPSEDEKKTRSVYGSSSEDPEAACLVPGDYAVESPLSLNYFTEHENYMEMKSDCATHSSVKRSLSLDEVTESVANDFLNMLGSDAHSAASTHRFDSPSLYSNVCDSEMASEYVSLEDLVPLALDKIEVLSIQGLRIQELQVLDDIRENSSAAVGLLDLSLTLDEWLRIDAGMSNEGKVSQQATSVLRAHQAKPINIVSDILGGGSPVRYGVLGNNLTVAFMIQLRDPLRDCEPVGALMLALIQAQREFLHLDMPEEGPIGFKICDVHVSGLNTDPGRTQLWGTKAQQQSGVRWLLASGLSKSHKYPVSNSKAIVLSHPQQNSKVATGDILWSISCGWEEGAGFTRNPDVEIPGQCH